MLLDVQWKASWQLVHIGWNDKTNYTHPFIEARLWNYSRLHQICLKYVALAYVPKSVISQETVLKLIFYLVNTHKDYTPTHAQMDSCMCITIHCYSMQTAWNYLYIQFQLIQLTVLSVFSQLHPKLPRQRFTMPILIENIFTTWIHHRLYIRRDTQVP